MKTSNETMTQTVKPAGAKARMRRMRANASSLSRKALSVMMSAILVVGLSPLTKASATADESRVSTQSAQGQLPSGTYWYNGDMSFTTIDGSNGFTSGAWDAYRDTGKDGSGNALGIAGSFHLVAFDTLSSFSHIYGNILANHVTNIQDYGVKPEFANIYGHGTLSYIQDYQATNGRFGEQSYDNQAIVFGNNTDTFSLTSYQNNGHETIKFQNKANSSWGGSEVTFPRTIAQDLDTANAPFIDMNAVKAETASLSGKLSQHGTDGATYDFSDQNRKTISYTKGSGCAYLTLPLSALTQNGNPLYIKGLPLDGSAALVINIDCGGADAPIPDQVWLEAGNGQNAGLGENDADTGYVLWNFTNAKTVTAMGMVSSILAPGATINLKGNSCGTFIGDNINVSGETHTRPFHGKFEEKDQPKPETTSVSVNKQWLDSKGNAETADVVAAHAGVKAQLLANGEKSGDAVELNVNNDWSYTWSDLPVKDADGKVITYEVQETTSTDGYTSSIDGSAAAGFTITNKHKPEVSVSAEKVWDDNGNVDQLRPASLTVDVMRAVEGGAAEKIDTLTLSADNDWKASLVGLPKESADGKQYAYSVREGVVAGYAGKTEGSQATDEHGNVAYSFTLTNTHAPSKVSVSVSKTWNDGNNQDGIRPTSLKVQLLRSEGKDGAKAVVQEIELTAKNSWQATVGELPVWGPNGKYSYSVSEAKVKGYTSAVKATTDASGNYTFALTNTHATETTSVGVTKVWSDRNNVDGLRPTSVEVELLANGKATGKKATLAAGSWAYTWTGLAKKADGKDIEYSVSEAKVNGYASSVAVSKSDDGAFAIKLTNTHEQAKTSVSVTKKWNDGNDQDGLRPASVEVQLYRSVDGGDPVAMTGYKVELNKGNSWQASWTDLPANEGGKAITYTVKEANLSSGYTCSISGNAGTDGKFAYTLTNTHEIGKTSVSVAKKWDDANNVDDIRPESVKVQLLANGVAVGQPVELNAANSWAYQWKDLDVKAKGQDVEYTVSELDVPEGYEASVSGDAANGFVVTNKHEVAKTAISVSKAWNDAENQDGLRPESVQVQLYANGTAAGDPVTLNADSEWKHVWDNLDKFANGAEIKYTVAELNVPAGYTPVISGGAAEGFAITNTHVAKVTNIGVKKVWDDADNQDGIRPASVTAQLLADGETVATVELSADNAWAASWSDLPVYANGKEIAYAVQEAGTPEGYTSSVAGNVANGFTITNTHAAAETAVSVHKVWKDAEGNEQAGVHPAVTAQLYRAVAGGEPEAMAGYLVALDEANDWAASWANLSVKSNGQDVTYSVQEADVPAGYQSAVSADDEGSYAFTMTNTAEKRVSVSVAKAWSDGDNADGVRPTSVTAQLCTVDTQNNLVAVAGKTVDLSAANSWAYTWDDLAAVDAEGNDIVYAVQEANVPAGYESAVSGGQVDGGNFAFTMTNTHELDTVDIDVSKIWNDENDVDGLRPDSVTAELCYVNAAGETVPVEGAEQKVLNEDNGWAAAWTGLVANDGGKAVKYTVREVAVPEGYASSVSGIDNGDGTYSFTMTNTHEAEVAEFALSGFSVRSITAPVPEAGKVCYVDPKINKALIGRTLQDGEFSFQLIDKATGEVVSTATNDALGKVDFDAAANKVTNPEMEPSCLEFHGPGTFTYEVRETPGASDPTIDYSAEKVEFVTTIADVDGQLEEVESHYVHYKDANDTVGTIVPATEHPTITNRVKAIELGLTKTDEATGAALPGATYGLYRADATAPEGEVLVVKAASDANGHMAFTTTGGTEVIATGVDYWFEELSAPEGYVRSLEPTQQFRIERVGTGADSGYQLVYANGSKGQLYSVGTVIEFGDGKAGVTDKALVATVTKVNSARNALAGAKLGVRLADGTDPIDEWTSSGAGHVLSGLKADTPYVLYEASVPDGFEKAADVTFALDEFGAIKLVDGAWNDDTLNAYATDGSLSLVDYTHSELVEHKVKQREETKTAPGSNKTGKLTQTGDQSPVLPLVGAAVVALAVIVIAGVALAKRRKR